MHEEDLSQTIDALKIAADFSAQSVVLLKSSSREETRLSLRMAGAVMLVDEMPSEDRLWVLLDHLTRESQEKLRAAGGTDHS